MKRFPVEYREQAGSDIEDIFAYVFERSADLLTALRYADRIYARCESGSGASRLVAYPVRISEEVFGWFPLRDLPLFSTWLKMKPSSSRMFSLADGTTKQSCATDLRQY